MPTFEISSTGGLFTATTSWVGGVVPPSSATSDILGSATSGPLYLNNLGTRTIGSLLLSDYTSTLGFTGSATSLIIQGLTFSLGSSMSLPGNIGTGALNSQRFIVTPNGATAIDMFFNGIDITNFRLEISSSGANTGKYKIWDKLKCKDKFVLFTHAGGGPTVNAKLLGSGTAGVPAQIELDAENAADNTSLWIGARPMANLGYEATFTIVGTGSGKVYWSAENYYGNKNSIPQGSTLEIQSGHFFLAPGILAITKGSTLKYTGGTVSGSKRLLAHSFRTTNSTDDTNIYIDTPNLTWGSIDLRQEVDGANIFNFYIQNSLSTNNFFINDVVGSVSGGSFVPKVFNIYGTNSNINLGQFRLSPFLSGGGVFTNGFWYGNPQIFFQGGFTYSFQRFSANGSFFTEFGNEFSPTTPSTRTIISATGGSNVDFILNLNESASIQIDFRDINVIGPNKLYAFGSTWSNSTNIESILPTASTASGGETSYVFIE